MTRHELPDGGWVEIRSRKTITGRESRAINRLYMPMLVATRPIRELVNARLQEAGFDPEAAMIDFSQEDQEVIRRIRNEANVDAFAGLSDRQRDDIEAYQPFLVQTMIEAWSYEVPITSDEALDLGEGTYAALCKLANDEWDNVPDESVDGATDPKAATADSSD